MKFLVGGDIIDSSSAVAADYVIAALEPAVAIELFTVHGLFRYGADHGRGQAGHIEVPQDEKFHEACLGAAKFR
jgi:hypothetical protein